MDIALTQGINALAGTSTALDQIMVAITNYGIYALVAAVVLLWWKPRQRLETRNACVLAGAAFIASLAFNQLLLLFFHRLRPYDSGVTHLLVTANSDWSFPSDHATAAAAIVAALWFKQLKRMALMLSGLALLICFSRIFVGVHYASDILGGTVIGGMAAFLLSRLYQDSSWYARRLVRIL